MEDVRKIKRMQLNVKPDLYDLLRSNMERYGHFNITSFIRFILYQFLDDEA